MAKNIDKIICVNKDLFNKARLITKNTADLTLDETKDKYLIEESDFKKVFDQLYKTLRDKQIHTSLNVSGADLSRYNELSSRCDEIKYNKIRNNFDDIKSKDIDLEELLGLYVDLYEEIENISKIKLIIEQIKSELNEIRFNNLSDNINSYVIRFNSLIRDGALLEDYLRLRKELDLIIKKTYEEALTSTLSDDKKVYIVECNGKTSIMNKSNINMFSYGYIYSPSSIEKVTNKSNKGFVSFDNYNMDTDTITLNDEKPIAVFAVTYGEHEINPNYIKAINLNAPSGVPFKEIDITLYPTFNEDYSKLINNLLIDKGLDVGEKDKDYYDKFGVFTKEFQKLKIKDYYSSQVINIFDFYFNAIFSQRYLEVSNLLDQRLEIRDIKAVLECNIYYDCNIFRSGDCTKTKIKEFISKFYEYRYNELLNKAYPGISIILDALGNASDEKIEEIKKLINSSSCHDSWLISQKIKSMNKKQPQVIVNKDTKPEIKDEQERTIWFYSFLKSNDSYSRHK